MGTTLEGKQINQTYQGLLKTTDNAEVSGTAKEITDGKGNGTGVTLDNAGNVSATSFTGDGSGLTNLPSGAVSSVNTQTGAVVLDTDDIGEGSTNQYFTTVRAVNAVTGGNLDMSSYDITTTGKIYFANVFSTEGDLPSASTYHGMFAHVHATGKAYFAHSGSWHKLLDEDSSNTDDLSEGSSNLYYTDARVSANSAVAANTAKTGITTQQADDIVANNAKVTRRPITAGGNTLETSESLTLTAGSNVTITEADGTVTIASTGGAGSIDLGTSTTTTSVTVTNSGGTDATISEASSSAAGVMSTAHHDKLDGIEENAEVNTVDSVNGAIGAVSLDTADLTDVAATAPTNGQVLQYNSTSSNYEPVTLSSTAPVDSVNGQTGAVVLDADDIAEGTTNLYYTDARADARVNLQTGSNLDLSSKSTSDLSEGTNLYYTEARVSANTSVAANTAKTSMVLGTTAGTALEGDTALLQLGTTSTTALAGDTTTISAQQASDISTNNAKVGITTQQASDITANNAKVGITTQQASDITANNAKVSMVLGTTAGTALEGDTPLLQLGTTSTTALAGDTVIPTNNNQLTNGASYITASSTDTLTNKSGSNSQWTNDENYLTGNETVTLSGDITGSGTTAITASIANNVVGADELNVSGNGTSGQVLASDGDGTFSWADAGGSYTPNIVSGATTASKDNLYIFTASATLTLPASPSGGDSIKVSNLSGTTTCVLARNGSNIMADASDMTLDNQYASFELIYGDATRGWVVVGGN
jgi:hypothetical protein